MRRNADIVISAGFLLADATATMAKRFPDTHFAITDYPVEIAPFADKNGHVLYPNVQGLTYASNEAGCLVGVLAAKMAERMGKKTIGAVGGLKIPPVDIWIAGYQFCAQQAVPGTACSSATRRTSSRPTSARRSPRTRSPGAQVLFQVAGGCGLGTLKAADQAGRWGIGVDVDQYKLAKRVLTSGVKRVDNGVYQAIKQVQAGEFAGGTDLVFDLKNDGVGVGKINPAVPQEDIDLMNEYKAKIIDGTLKVPGSAVEDAPLPPLPRRVWRNIAVPPGRAARPEGGSSVAPQLTSLGAPCVRALGTTIAPRRRALFRQTLLESSGSGGGHSPRNAGDHQAIPRRRRQRPRGPRSRGEVLALWAKTAPASRR